MIDGAAIGKFLGSVTLKGWLIVGGVGLLVAAIVAAVLIADNAVEDTLDAAEGKGRAEAKVDGQNTTLDQVGAANEGRNEITGGRSAADYEQCLRDSAPGYERSCERFKPL